jgi:hypothetical protein
MFDDSDANEQQLGTDLTIDPECGCPNVPKSDVVAVPSAGRVCYGCHTPFQIGAWDDILDTTRVAHRRGETTAHRQLLIGLDAAGGAVYLDSLHRDLITVVPKHHYAYQDDLPNDAPILRRHADHSIGSPLNAPDGDVLTIVTRTDIGDAHHQRHLLAEYLVDVVPGRTPRTRWDAVSDHSLRVLRTISARRSTDRSSANEYRALARLYGGNNRPFPEAL